MDAFRRPDAKGKRSHAAIGASVAVATCDREAGKDQNQFGRHNMDDALTRIEIEQADTGGGSGVPQALVQSGADRGSPGGSAGERRGGMISGKSVGEGKGG